MEWSILKMLMKVVLGFGEQFKGVINQLNSWNTENVLVNDSIQTGYPLVEVIDRKSSFPDILCFGYRIISECY